MVNRIGNIDSFAIDYKVEKLYVENDVKWLFGNSRLIINRHILGDWNDINHLGVLVAQLKGILNLRPSDNKVRKYSKKELSDLTRDPDMYNENSFNLIHLAENFDNYLVLVHNGISEITFVWRFIGENNRDEAATATVNYLSFQETVRQFEAEYQKEINDRFNQNKF